MWQEEIELKAKKAKQASRKLCRMSTEIKNHALTFIAREIEAHKPDILSQNQKDLDQARASGMSPHMLDRLVLSEERLKSIQEGVLAVVSLPDPVGELFDMRTLPNGLILGKMRVPLGVIGAIYESRPNVTVDIACLCLKSGNACLLRGGKEAIHSNISLSRVIGEALRRSEVGEDAVQLIESTDRALLLPLLSMKEYIDLVVPRGGAELIRLVSENAKMPVVSGGIGVCHTYVDRSADLSRAVAIAFNAKVQRPTVCNALDTLLVHEAIAPAFLPRVASQWGRAGVEMHADERSFSVLKSLHDVKVIPATDSDWGKEFLSLTAAIKVVSSLDEALEHIGCFGSGHSEAIVTSDLKSAQRFLTEVDAACVYVNASTRFTDGEQFGLGAEVGISTQKFHARGPMGLKELTTYKWVILGSGQVRP
jgi:glutamate-5-semialdehyde dehydrogenase